jgi:hypothetical protein
MVSFLSFVTLVMAGMVVASAGSNVGRRGLRMERNLEKREETITCSDNTQAEFISDSWVEICLRNSHPGYLTADSYFEAMTIVSSAISYINDYGVQDPLFVAYFGNLNNSTFQLNIYNVCPGLSW